MVELSVSSTVRGDTFTEFEGDKFYDYHEETPLNPQSRPFFKTMSELDYKQPESSSEYFKEFNSLFADFQKIQVPLEFKSAPIKGQ